jgi:hypothetical protein
MTKNIREICKTNVDLLLGFSRSLHIKLKETYILISKIKRETKWVQNHWKNFGNLQIGRED